MLLLQLVLLALLLVLVLAVALLQLGTSLAGFNPADQSCSVHKAYFAGLWYCQVKHKLPP